MSDLRQVELDSQFLDGAIIAESAMLRVMRAHLRERPELLNPLIDAACEAVHGALVTEIGEPRILACQEQASALFRKGTN